LNSTRWKNGDDQACAKFFSTDLFSDGLRNSTSNIPGISKAQPMKWRREKRKTMQKEDPNISQRERLCNGDEDKR
jgi:hypothetical protein